MQASAVLLAVYGIVSCGVGLMLLFAVNADQRPSGSQCRDRSTAVERGSA